MIKQIAIKGVLGAIGLVYIYFGLSISISNFIYIIKGYPVFEVIGLIKILTVIYYLYMLYSIVLGICIFTEKRWVSRGVVPTPALFVIFECFAENQIELGNYILLFSFFIFSTIFLNINPVKNHLKLPSNPTGGHAQ